MNSREVSQMSWTNELYRVYELAVSTKDGNSMLPISHSTAQAQIEVTVDEDGEFVRASLVSKDDAKTVIPVTEDSAARSSGITPMPLADKLVYIAGDFSRYACGKRTDNSEYYGAYMKQLGGWCESENSHYAIKAIYKYLSKKELIKDLVSSGLLILDEQTQRFTDKKFGTVSQEDSFVRFIISGKDGLCFTWKDSELHKDFIAYYESLLGAPCLCYSDGKAAALTYKHPAKIRNSADKAKLISANDTANFTYRGRFATKEEAVCVSYEYSQKMHNALKWLIENERVSKSDEKTGKTITYNPMQFDSLTLVVWNSALDFVPNITESAFALFDGEGEYSSMPKYAELLHNRLMGGNSKIGTDNKVMIMGLDAATTGRLSISLYTELAQSQFAANLEKWHKDTVWKRFKSRIKKTVLDSCSLPEIAKCLYGTEQSGTLDCDKKLIGETILRMLPCVYEGRKLPSDIVRTLVNRASSPLAYEKEYNHRMIIENACALIRKEYKDHGKGEITMSYEPTNTDRSYLFGCLLAIADKAERDAYEKDEKRVTNARRLWSAFYARPYQTWGIIEERLEPYLEKAPWIMTKYTKHINEIMAKMSTDVFSDNSKLSPMYLIGYHHYNALLWNAKEENKEEN